MDDDKVSFRPQRLEDIVAAPPEPTEAPTPEPEATPQPEVKEEPQEAETPPEPQPKGDEPAKEPESATPAQKTETPDQQGLVPRAALQAERNKRQKLEAKVHDIQRQLNQSKRPDPIDDPDGAREFDEQQRQNREWETLIGLSSDIMRQIHPDDFDDMANVFMDAAEKNPALAVEMRNSPNPAGFVYEQGKRHHELAQLGDKSVPEVVAEAVAKAREDAVAETMKLLEEKGLLAKPALPTSLAEAPSATTVRDANKYEGPKPIKDILAARPR